MKSMADYSNFLKTIFLGGNRVWLSAILSQAKNLFCLVSPKDLFLGQFYLFYSSMTSLMVWHQELTSALYADDTKIWRTIYSEHDQVVLQNDVRYLHEWSLRNKMKLHPNKCKVLSVANNTPPASTSGYTAQHPIYIFSWWESTGLYWKWGRFRGKY